jgi:hypothetical protein
VAAFAATEAKCDVAMRVPSRAFHSETRVYWYPFPGFKGFESAGCSFSESRKSQSRKMRLSQLRPIMALLSDLPVHKIGWANYAACQKEPFSEIVMDKSLAGASKERTAVCITTMVEWHKSYPDESIDLPFKQFEALAANVRAKVPSDRIPLTPRSSVNSPGSPGNAAQPQKE